MGNGGGAMPRPPPSDRLGDAILEARRALGISQAKAAKQAGMATETWSRIERARITPGIDALTRMASVLGVSIDDLVGLKPAKAPKALTLRPADRRLLEVVVGLEESDVDRVRRALKILFPVQSPPQRRTRP